MTEIKDIPIIPSDDIPAMTGIQLMRLLGMVPPIGCGGRVLEYGQFTAVYASGKRTDWTVRRTRGCGRNSGKTYTMICRKCGQIIYDPQGNIVAQYDSGGFVGIRGHADDLISTYKYV